MRRAKLARAFIENQKKRNTSFRQKKGTLIKKALEFSILCDVPVCVIVFPFDEGNKKVVQPEIYSYKGEQENVKSDESRTNNPELGREIINRYLAYPKDFQKSKRSLNLSDVLKDVNKEKLINVDQDYTNLSKFTNDQLIALLGKLDDKIDSVKSRIDVIKNVSNNDGFDPKQQEIEVLSDDDGFLLSDLDIDLDVDAMFEDLKVLTAPTNNGGIYNMDMMGVTPNYIEIDHGSRFVDNYPLQGGPMVVTTPSPSNSTDNNQRSRVSDNYLLECIPMMSTTSTSNTCNNQESRYACNYPLQGVPMMTTWTSYTDNNQGFQQCVPMMGLTSTTYTDNNQGSTCADNYPLHCAPMMGTTSTSYTDYNQGSDNYPLQQNSMMFHSIYNGDLRPQFVDNYPLQCNLMMNSSIYNGDLGQRFVDNYLLQHGYPMIGHAV